MNAMERKSSPSFSWFEKNRLSLSNRRFWLSVLCSCFYLTLSLFANFYAGLYATEHVSNSVTDIVLSNIRVFDVDGFFVYGSLLFWAFIAFICLKEPAKLPFTVKSIALFVVVRSVFISLTHIGPFPTQAVMDSNLISDFTFGGDLFFSGHTGLPFLMALIFWNQFRLRLLFLCSSVFFGIIVLLAHLHYSIDVLSAFFITYTIFHIAEKLFASDRKFFYGVHNEEHSP